MQLDFKTVIHSIGTILFLSIFFISCKNNEKQSPPKFELLRKEHTGLDFENQLQQSSEFNVFNYMYFFNGGGLAAGDFNNDGLVDLYFTNNMGSNKLFLNEDNFQFKDVTEAAGMVGMEGWTSGASVVDINNDGLLDIYVSQIGDYKFIKGQNQLYVNQGIEDGIPTFQDEAIPYGLDLVGFGTHANFFDYDLDGDLDMYMMNHSLHDNGTFGQKKTFIGTQHPTSGDKLLRNDDGLFTEVTMEAGINSTVIGYGLGVVTGDLNLDGWPDIFIGNDFHENDYLYINQQDGTFKEVLTEQMMHTSRFSMGVDMADITNDGLSEIISLDMLPEDPFILKSSLGEDTYNIFTFKLGYGYNHQFARNNLHLNNGNGSFSEIGMFAGIHATDWSWAPLFIDFDHDGYKDLFISNGIPRRMNDIDYVNFRANHELRWKSNTNNLEEEDLVLVDKMPQIKLPNKFFRNTGNLQFEDWAHQIKNAVTTYSNGAIYADLDNDGDLDIVVNNIEDEPFVYKNLNNEQVKNTGNYLSLSLKGSPKNIEAIGTKVVVFKDTEQLTFEHFPVRGYQSSMLSNLHLGLGSTSSIDSIILIWPDRTYQKLEVAEYNQVLDISWKAGLPILDFEILKPKNENPFHFEEATDEVSLDFVHDENPFVEFNREALIPHAVSSEGPALAVGDLNGDGLEDVYMGNSKRRKAALFFQTKEGKFQKAESELFTQDSLFEDVDAVFEDIENDGDLDLIIATGGNEFSGTHDAMKQRVYLNDGRGNLSKSEIFSEIYMTASCVLPADFNKDGLVDFFFGARAVPWNYGHTPTSALMENKGNGTFENVTEKYVDDLAEVGLVKNGTWVDIDSDGDEDLILAVEWEAITVFLNDNSKFKKVALPGGKGWWNFVLAEDFDGDGDTDILAGNFGKNSKFKPSDAEPVKIYIEDFDDNDKVEQILTYYLGGREIPFANHAEITGQLPPLKKKFLYSKDFAAASLPEIFGKEKLKTAVVREVTNLKSMYFENVGDLKFDVKPLPDELQFSTLNTALWKDLNQDGQKELLVGGNFYECNIEMGRYDANFGNVLTIEKGGLMKAYPLGSMTVKGQTRRIEPINIAGTEYFIFARNDESAMVLKSL